LEDSVFPPYPIGDGAAWASYRPAMPSRSFDAASVDSLSGQEISTVSAADVAQGVLHDIDDDTARAAQLADHLLALLVAVDDAHRADVIPGFLQPIAKLLEARFTTEAKVSGDWPMPIRRAPPPDRDYYGPANRIIEILIWLSWSSTAKMWLLFHSAFGSICSGRRSL
jgi:hypothetical protein